MSADTNRILDRLSSAFSKEPDSILNKILSTLVTQLQNIDEVAASVVYSHQYRYAAGKNLENITATFGVSRVGGISDTTLRENLSIVLWQNRSSGTIEDVQKIVAFITGVPESAVRVVEPQAGQFRIIVDATWRQPFRLAGLYNAVHKTKAGGIHFLDDQTIFVLIDPHEGDTYDSMHSGLVQPYWG